MYNISRIQKIYSNRQRLSLIYVDDNHFLLDIMKLFLEQEHLLKVQTFISPENALNFLKCNKADIILSDYDMPGMNGADFLLHLRSEGIMTPFILYTSSNHNEVDAQVFKLDDVYYIPKTGPIEQHILQLKSIIGKYKDINPEFSHLAPNNIFR